MNTWTEVLRSNWPDNWVREIAGFLGFVVGLPVALLAMALALPSSTDRAFVPSGSSPQAVSPVPASIPSVGEHP